MKAAENDPKKLSELLLLQNRIIKRRTFSEKYVNWKGLLFLIAWLALIVLLIQLPNMSTKDFATFEPYSILGVELDASNDVIRKAYRKLSLKFHPDKNPENKEEAAEKFQLVAKAYTALTDPRVKANMQKYGNPDGFKGFSVTYGLPEFLSSKNNEVYILLGYLVFCLVIPGIIFLVWYKKSQAFHETGIHNETIKHLVKHSTPEISPGDMWEMVAAAVEFSHMFPIEARKEELKRLLPLVSTKIPKIKERDIFYVLYVNILLGAYLNRIEIQSPQAKEDLKFILSKVHNILRIFLEIGKASRMFNLVIAAINNMQLVTQAMANSSSSLFQLPMLSTAEIALLKPLKIESVDQFLAADAQKVTSALKWSTEQYDKAFTYARCFPSVKSHTRVHVPGAEEITTQDVMQFDISLHRRSLEETIEQVKEEAELESMSEEQKKQYAQKKQAKLTEEHRAEIQRRKAEFMTNASLKLRKGMSVDEKRTYERELSDAIRELEVVDIDAKLARSQTSQASPYAVSAQFPVPHRETWYVMVCILTPKGEQFIVDWKTVTNFDKEYQVRFVMKAPENEGVYAYQVYVMSDSYVDTNVFHRIFTRIYAPETLKKQKLEKLIAEKKAEKKTSKKAITNEKKDKEKKKGTDADADAEVTSTGSSLLDAMAAEAKRADVADASDEEAGDDELDLDLEQRLAAELDELDNDHEDYDEEEEETEEAEEEGKWYYLGAGSFMEMVLNVTVLSVLGFFAYNWLESRGYWQKFFVPPINVVLRKINPLVKQVYKVAEPTMAPIFQAINTMYSRFLGEM